MATYVIGSDVPAAIEALAADDFVILGYVPDIVPYLTGCRVSISPLRYGAGVKGKINPAMSHGLPVVATTASIEGMYLTDGADVLVADDAGGVCARDRACLRGRELWERLSAGGCRNIEQHFSRAIACDALKRLLALAPK